MKALTMIAPWTWAILFAGKRIENRSWSTNYRGDLLLHNGKKHDALGEVFVAERVAREGPHGLRGTSDWWDMRDLPGGALVGVATLVNVVPRSLTRTGGRDLSERARREIGDLTWGQPDAYWFLLDNVRVFREPIPYRGAPGLYDVEGDLDFRNKLAAAFELAVHV